MLLASSQLLAPRATPPTRAGIALVLCEYPPKGAASLLAHSLPARPQRRCLLDAPTPLRPGQYLLSTF